MGLLDDLFGKADTVKEKDDGQGKRWEGGHESTRVEADGKIDHHHTNHETKRISGWKYDPKTGESEKYTGRKR
jgi:hypothetical protein